MINKFFYFLFSILYFLPQLYNACTTAVVSGKATPDGRPLLYKNRDTHTLHSRLVYSTQGKYSYIGVANPSDIQNISILNGHNNVGFAIINSDSYNINPIPIDEKDRQDGVIMRLALESCKNLKDFENLLNSFPKPWKLNSNFGVIDAEVGAAYYETGSQGFVKYDANNPITAPFGYIIRTNYSFSAEVTQGQGFSRYLQAQDLLYKAALKNELTPQYFTQRVARSLQHGLTGEDLTQNKREFAAFRDFIPRYYTASAVVFQGVKPGENSELTIGWNIIGSTLGAVAIPLFVNKKHLLPQVLTADSSQHSLLDNWATEIKDKLFPITKGEGPNYIRVPLLLKTLPKIIYIENQIFYKADGLLNQWRNKNRIDENELYAFYSWVDNYTKQQFTSVINELP